MGRTLSKSRFKLALECPTKVFYSLDRRYVNTRDEDEFLQALADGGFQVGELAKRMYAAEDPGAVEITTRDQDEQVWQTAELIARENVTIFEGTIRHGNLLVRVDVLWKRGNVVDLIEVKSKSFDPNDEDNAIRGKKGGILGPWLPYLRDVAFQTYVMRLAYPDFQVRPYLLLVDPTAPCSVDGVGTAIRVQRETGRQVEVTVEADFDATRIRPPLLRQHDIEAFVTEILAGVVDSPAGTYEFPEFVRLIAEAAVTGQKVAPSPGKQCKKCEYYCEPGERNATHLSGWAECMEARFAGRGQVPRASTVFALYNHRAVDKLLAKGKLLLNELDEDDIEGKQSEGEISNAHRNRLQIRESKESTAIALLRKPALRKAFDGWRFPLHFIDFETASPTLPFTAGRRPHEQLLFQFSHHVLDAAGRLEHRSQCLMAEPSVVPNAAVVRDLRKSLSSDDGTVLHWWTHENTVLKKVRDQLRESTELDKDELISFIGSLVDGPSARLVDMGLPLVSRTAFIAGTDGRSSIKKVLQAVMQQSEFLMQRYGRPVYGTPAMPSLNRTSGYSWWQMENGVVKDPYSLLGQLLSDSTLDVAARAAEDEEASDFVANGGAAMVAYGELQRRDLPDAERKRLEKQLLRYCELDTLAMVMVYEAIREWVQ